jgi:tripartite ATP-independent transporter DctM subunit
VIAGSSVLGMLIPPSVMLILYAVITEQSIGDLFLAGVLPGIALSVAYAVLIIGMAYLAPGFVGRRAMSDAARSEAAAMTVWEAGRKMIAPVGLIGLVMGGIYGAFDGWFWGAISLKFTPTEAGAVGALLALFIALAKRSLTWKSFWGILVETGHITASILFLIIAASMYSRMLGITGIPSELGDWLRGLNMGFTGVIVLYVVLLLLMGTILDTVSIILIVVPLFLPVLIPAEGALFANDVVWFGIVTVIGAEIGLLTPPLGIACFVIKSTLDDKSITLYDIFAGAFPFAVTMLLVLILIIAIPWISLALI